ncbi:MAG TPA: hypothetical protein VH458_09980 [Vicinamibacterales bacterium]|jgi:hypothetical protein
MLITSIRCPVLGARVSRLADLEGRVTDVICPEYETASGDCRLKVAARRSGPLAQLVERASEDALDTDSRRCLLAER